MVQFQPFQNLTEQELKMVLEWRNLPLVRKLMNHTEPISLDRHLQFVESLVGDQNRACYLVKEDNRFIGVIQLNEIYNNAVRDVGMYVNPTLLNRGVGMRLGFYGAQYLFTELRFESLYFMALRENKAALNMWRVLGIKQVEASVGRLVLGQLLRKDFLLRPQDFRGYIKSNNTI